MSTEQPTHHGYAVNVKDRELYPLDTEPLTEGEVQAIYDEHGCEFWELVQDVGRDHGFREVYSEGRSGGYAVPVPQPSTHSIGPSIEYVPEAELEAWMDERFRPFERDVLSLMAGVREEFKADLADAVDRAKREPAEAAHWAARDTITVDR